MIPMNDGPLSRIEFGIEAPRVKYRKLTKEADAHDDDASAAAASSGAFIARTEAMTSMDSGDFPIEGKHSPAVLVPASNVEVPLSITCDSVTKTGAGIVGADGTKKRDRSYIESPLTITPKKSYRVDTSRSIDVSLHEQDSVRSFNSGSRECDTHKSVDDEVVMRLPKWMQSSSEAQQDIFCK
ncbi:hypothetical protein ACHAXA_009689 [Cyclostephanos tholiformis]|uniref:Uncharacterized protein n=1 Tax=Cyclostephanos tholiformis TaxID=382380 RepID=A0ABD3RTT7_9STRA